MLMRLKTNENMTTKYQIEKSPTQGEWRSYGCTVYSGEMVIAGAYCEGNRNLSKCLSSEDVPNSEGLCGEGWDEAMANARLIAAAPELLEALKGLLEVTEENYDNRHEVEAAIHAIAKAEGRAEP